MDLAFALAIALAVAWLVIRFTRPLSARRDRVERILPLDEREQELLRRHRATREIAADPDER